MTTVTSLERSTRHQQTDVGQEFIEAGYVLAPAEDRNALDRIREKTAAAAAAALGISMPPDIAAFLNEIHERVAVADLNRLRLSILDLLHRDTAFRVDYVACGRKLLEAVVGNELAAQRNIALSVQFPNDDSSLIPLHSDTWGSECSPFEVVLWIPLVDCARTKSMFLLPPDRDRFWRERVNQFESQGTEALFKAVEPEVKWIEVSYGKVIVFTPTLMHGNRVNRETTTRWSFNARFKGLFTPYANKRLGDFFVPLSVSPASQVALAFDMPEGPGV